MSFILDALKKSETDRQQKSSPGIADVPTAPGAPPSPPGVWILVGVLATAVVVLLGVLLRPGTDTATHMTETPTVQSPQAQPAESRTPRAEPTLAAETPGLNDARIGSDDLAAAPASEPARAQTPPPRIERRSEPSPPEREPAPAQSTPAPAPAPETETLLTFNDLRASGSIALPDLHIDLHVYSDNPTERFVFINMNQYRENATLTEGPRLRQITSEGVLLEYVGTTFLLPRE